MFPRARDIKERINKWDLIKIKKVYAWLKKTALKWKENQPHGKTYLPMIPQTRVWSPKYIKNSYDFTLRRQATQLKNGQRTWTDTSSRRTYRGSRDMKGCSASLAIREKQIKTTIKCHFTPVRMAIVTKSTNNKCWWGCGEKEPLCTVGGNADWCSHCGEQYGISSEN